MNFKKITFSTNNLEILQQDDDVMIVSLRLLHTGRNANRVDLPKLGVEDSIPTFWNKPIIYKFNNEYFPTDVDDHNTSRENSFMNIAGSIIESGGYKWVREDEVDYLEFIGVIHKIYQPVLVDIIKNRDGDLKVSIEIKPTKAFKDNDGYLVVERFKLLSVCLLGKQIREGIENSRLNVVKFSAEVYNEKFLKFSEDFKMKYGTKSSIKLNKSKDSVSFDKWGDVDKIGLRNRVLEAKNYKTLIKSVYLKIEEGWENAPSEKLKYPVMQIKDGELIYNRYAISSALGYAKAEEVQDVVDKANSLLDKLNIKEGEQVKEKEEVMVNQEEEVVTEVEETEKFEAEEETQEEEIQEEVEEEKEEDVEETESEEEVIDYKCKFESLEVEYNSLIEKIKEYERKEEIESMKEMFEKFSHCFEESEKKAVIETINEFSFEDFQAKIDNQIKEYALSQKEEEKIQAFSDGFVDKTEAKQEKKDFDIFEYAGLK